MKKIVILLFLFIFSTPCAPSDETPIVLELIKTDIFIVNSINIDQKFKKKIQVIRYRSTPSLVNILFKYNLSIQECIAWKDFVIVIPGHSELRCEMVGGTEECSEVWVEDSSVIEKKCVQSEEQTQVLFKKIIFDFTSAAPLSASSREVFEVEISQPKLDSGKFEMRGRLIDGSERYEIFSRSFLHKYQTLYFVRAISI